jgi:hypothetical protein
MFNAQTRKVYNDWFAKMPEISKKYGIKMVAACTVNSEHLTISILEAPSLDAIQKASMEPEFFAVNSVDTVEIKPALNMEEGVKLFQQAQQIAPIPAR